MFKLHTLHPNLQKNLLNESSKCQFCLYAESGKTYNTYSISESTKKSVKIVFKMSKCIISVNIQLIFCFEQQYTDSNNKSILLHLWWWEILFSTPQWKFSWVLNCYCLYLNWCCVWKTVYQPSCVTQLSISN